ncbi:MAG: hypothetical protein RL456_2766 [Pseudomonadota bacterium]
MVLLQACGGGDEGEPAGDGGSNGAVAGITEGDVALYARAVNTYAVNCRRYGYGQDCAAYQNAVAYFDGKCRAGVTKACELSQDIQASYLLAGLTW